ncbi:hypothetical protein PAP18089_04576 [Pandoraea apista]|uniref:Uncharacterized protein n=1 Tax=Pandoraea apista TaxID=93218 RepID=A0A5E5PAG2_9BURK|nr:hypothetical protein PAP18089_04576 [Pandoraea apista]
MRLSYDRAETAWRAIPARQSGPHALNDADHGLCKQADRRPRRRVQRIASHRHSPILDAMASGVKAFSQWRQSASCQSRSARHSSDAP